MFEKGQYVNYGKHGVCVVEDITHIDIPGLDQNKLYYVLSKVYTKGNKIYTAVDNHKVIMREILTKNEAETLIQEIPEIEQLKVANDKSRNEKYKNAITSCDCREWVKVLKSLYNRKQDCIAKGKKVAITDERLYKEAEEHLYGELALSLGIEKNQVEEFIISKVEQSA
ncbi:MAG: CarD family transcriptional regulator [Lachnospiraceae bacterium]|nr:CarD family transcriptional regulator [Lachnospiraceae bacterium]